MRSWGVEAGLISWEILEVHFAMRGQKGVHLIAPVPHGAIDIQPNDVAAERAPQMAQGSEEALVVAVGMTQDAATPQERCHPPEDVQAFPMRTARGHPEALTAFRPTAPYAGMERETGLVFEDNGFVSAQCGESFFRLSRNCRASSERACT
jgi:hypothetical protein